MILSCNNNFGWRSFRLIQIYKYICSFSTNNEIERNVTDVLQIIIGIKYTKSNCMEFILTFSAKSTHTKHTRITYFSQTDDSFENQFQLLV